MKSRRILQSDHIDWDENGSSRINYSTVFDQNQATAEPEAPEQTGPDYRELLHAKEKQWQKKLKQSRKEAFEEGVNQGYRQGLEEARAELDRHLAVLEHTFEQAHREWRERQQLLEPGLIELAFDVAECILGIPLEHTSVRTRLQEELSKILEDLDEQVKPQLWISEQDYNYVEKLIDGYVHTGSVGIKISAECKPGEFKFESDRKTVVCNFQKMLGDFRAKLTLPEWN
jgi:flagellar biosynthesis/type III secretory pathway protein FliH